MNLNELYQQSCESYAQALVKERDLMFELCLKEVEKALKKVQTNPLVVVDLNSLRINSKPISKEVFDLVRSHLTGEGIKNSGTHFLGDQRESSNINLKIYLG